MDMQDRICAYWGKRADEYGDARYRDVNSRKWEEWRALIASLLPETPDGRPVRALDLGTGAGFFAFILRDLGCEVTGIDYTEEMIDNAVRNRGRLNIPDGDITFLRMDAQNLTFEDGRFDFIFSRNVTWTLPEPEKAYEEMVRVLAPGGRIANFDANYGAAFRRQDESAPQEESGKNNDPRGDTESCGDGDPRGDTDSREPSSAPEKAASPYEFPARSPEMIRERNDIAENLSVCGRDRPLWDAQVLTDLGIQRIALDLNIQLHAFGQEYYAPTGHQKENPAPLFMVLAQK